MPFTFEKILNKPFFTDLAPNENLETSLLGLKYFFEYKEEKLDELVSNLLKRYLKTKPCKALFFFSGRSALLNLLKALNLKGGDEALLPAFTCSTVVLPFLKLEIKPVFIDIEEQTFAIDPIDLQKKLSPKSKIILLQHTYGFTPAKRATILSIIKKQNLLLIEDIAHTIKPIKFDYEKEKQFYLLSFGRSKALSSVFGGAVVLQEGRIGKRLEKILNQLPDASSKLLAQILLYKLATPVIKSSYSWGFGKILLKFFKNFLPPEITSKERTGNFDDRYNLKLSKLQKAFLLAQLEEYEEVSQIRIKKANELLQKIPENYLPKGLLRKNITDPIIRLPIFTSNPEKLILRLKRKNIFLGRWYYQPIIGVENTEKLGYKKNSCPKAEEVGKRIITIGI